MNDRTLRLAAAALFFAAAGSPLWAWAYPGHRMINELALESLPSDVPGFLRDPATAERIGFLAGEPDRWRSSTDTDFLHVENSDHVFDLEQLAAAGLDAETLTPYRYDFLVEFARARAAHADRFPPLEPAKDRFHEYAWPGTLPWAVSENYGKLRELFSQYKTYLRYGTPREAADTADLIVDTMGIMGHFVGDSSQPLHVTVHHHGWDCFGWKAPNPHGYSTRFGIHDWIDGTGPGGGFIGRAGITKDALRPLMTPARPIDVTVRPDGRDPIFVAEMDFIIRQNREVEPLYELDKEGKLKADGSPGSFDGRPFIEAQLVKGAEMLGSLWLTAWRQAGPDVFLQSQLIREQAAKP
jgi:hypothetical protein